MIKIRRILCPTDFSEHSVQALRYAVSLAKLYDSTITSLHVHHLIQPPSTKLPVYSVRTQVDPGIRDRVLAELRRFVEPGRAAGIEVEEKFAEGDPVGEILRMSESMGADLLVLGTHGRGGFERLILGSVAEKVLRKARCPTLTVPRAAAAPGAAEPLVFRQILCPIDFSETSMKALEYALSLAKESDARIMLLHATEEFPEDAPLRQQAFNVPEYRRLLFEDSRQRLGKLIPKDARDWCHPEILVDSGKAYRAILKSAEAGMADLIAMGVRGRNPLDLMLFGSTTQHVVRHAACPILTIRSG
jgi:nucleotide-binding universal stress UspA family protein